MGYVIEMQLGIDMNNQVGDLGLAELQLDDVIRHYKSVFKHV